MFLFNESNRRISFSAFFSLILIIILPINACGTTFWVDGAVYDDTKCNKEDIVPPLDDPTPPAGYVFAGWAPAVEPCSKMFPDGDAKDFDYDATTMTWSVSWGSGQATVSGDALCSSTSANGNTGTPNESGGGEYCWCRMTLFNDGSTDYVPVLSLWAFTNTAGSASACASFCSRDCGGNVRSDSSLRSALFCPKI